VQAWTSICSAKDGPPCPCTCYGGSPGCTAGPLLTFSVWPIYLWHRTIADIHQPHPYKQHPHSAWPIYLLWHRTIADIHQPHPYKHHPHPYGGWAAATSPNTSSSTCTLSLGSPISSVSETSAFVAGALTLPLLPIIESLWGHHTLPWPYQSPLWHHPSLSPPRYHPFLVFFSKQHNTLLVAINTLVLLPFQVPAPEIRSSHSNFITFKALSSHTSQCTFTFTWGHFRFFPSSVLFLNLGTVFFFIRCSDQLSTLNLVMYRLSHIQ
jgi:hypothetical protein